MTGAGLAITRRLRSTPYTSRIEAAGVKTYTVYNHMLLPTQFRGVEADYHHLRSAVQIWDVACERQVEIVGPDAQRLAQLLTVRDLRSFDVGRCGYAPVLDHDGHLINDPVVLRVGTDRYWFSVSDSDVVLWAGGLAHGMGLNVRVHEPDVWPLAIQGPHAEDVAAAVFGDAVRDIRFFRFAPLQFRGHEMFVARSGWSAQGGFEIYVDDAELGAALYDAITDAGQAHDIGPGCPNLIERIEAGLFTYGTDVTSEHTALEAGLEKYCSLNTPVGAFEAIGMDAIRRQSATGLTQRLCGLMIDGQAVPHQRDPWPVLVSSNKVGEVTSAVWSPRLNTNVAMGMLAIDHTTPATSVTVEAIDGTRTARVVEMPFPGSSQR